MRRLLLTLLFVLIPIITIAAAPPVTDGLVAYFPFNGNANNEAGTAVGNGVVTTATLTVDRFGNADSAYSFDGASKIVIDDPFSIVSSPSGSISAWVALDYAGTQQNVIVSKDDTTEPRLFALTYTGSLDGGTFRAYHGDEANLYQYRTGTTVADLSGTVWYHVVQTWDNATGELKLYVNGIEEVVSSASTTGGNLSSPAPLVIGALGDDTFFFNGRIDDVAFYAKVLSPSEVVSLGAALSPSVNLPKTGQTDSIAAGDDGDLQRGSTWPVPRFTDIDGFTVQDNLTGLIWAKNATTPTVGACTGGTKNWFEALDYVSCLNGISYLGYTDWILPNRNELKSLLGADGVSSALPEGHPFTINLEGYWSSTTNARAPSSAWYVNMLTGLIYSDDTTAGAQYVWPVRAVQMASDYDLPKTGQTTSYAPGDDGTLQRGAAWPVPRFNDLGDGTVQDALTGLVWVQNAFTFNGGACTTGAKTWQGALDYVACLNGINYLGYSDWTLPNRNELMSLLDAETASAPPLPAGNPFTNVAGSALYWSSTSLASSPVDWGWALHMNDGTSFSIEKISESEVWPVRAAGITPPAVTQYTLSVTKSGLGMGTVSSTPAGIDCGGTCTANFDEATMVTLTASPNIGSAFSGWSGACTGIGDCLVTMDAAKDVTATFDNVYTLSVTKAGSGSGTIVPDSGSLSWAGNNASADYVDGTVVTLTATPNAGSSFNGWSGACFGTGPCEVTMDAVKSVSATFSTTFTPGAAAYIRGASAPWGSSSNETAMNTVFGAGGWTDLRMAAGAGPFQVGSGYTFIFVDGSDGTANELNTYLNTHRAVIEAWVQNGGRLLLNSAPNQGSNINFGFGGVTLTYAPSTSPVTHIPSVSVVNAAHPIFTGPALPVGTTFTGNYFAHATVAGGGIEPLLKNNDQVVLAELKYGSGYVVFGGMTTSNFHSPQPNANNLRSNIINYLNEGVSTDTGVYSLVTLQPTGLWHEVVDAQAPAGRGATSLSPKTWWYGQDQTGDFNTGTANSGALVTADFMANNDSKLEFWSYENTENSPSWDRRRIYVSADAGVSWQLLKQLNTENQWYKVEIDLSSYAGQLIRVKLDFDTIDSLYNNYLGWFVDDFSVVSGAGVEPPSITLFANTTYVDYQVGNAYSEASNLEASLVELGYTVPAFTGLTASELNAALAGKNTLIWPEMERGNPTSAMTPEARNVVTNFVSTGGTLVGSIWNGGFDLFNTLFAWNISRSSDSIGYKTANAVNNPFADGPASLPANNGTQTINISSLPANAKVMYANATETTAMVVVVPYGQGQVIFLGWDWFNAAPVGIADGGWLSVLDAAVKYNRQGAYVAPPPIVTYLLNASSVGTGVGTVTSSPAGINCGVGGGACSNIYDSGTLVTLTASSGPDSYFSGWSGACSGTGSCVVPMDANKSVAATFTSYPPVNGACGTAQAMMLASPPLTLSELCSAGSPSVVAGSGPWSWECYGDYGGTTASCSADAIAYAVTTAVSSGGSITPSVLPNIAQGSQISFSIAPYAGYQLNSVSGCSGTLSGNIYTTGPISGDCTVSADFSPIVSSGFDVQVNQVDTSYCPSIRSVVTVTGVGGQPIGSLTTSNFTVREDGQVKTPISVESAGGNAEVSVGLALDYSGSMTSGDLTAMQAAAQTFVAGLNDIDSAEIVKFSSAVTVVQPFTTDKTALSSAVSSSWAGAGQLTAFYDAVYKVIVDATTRPGRRAVIAMTDGDDTSSVNSLQQVINFSVQQGVPVFTVGLGAAVNASILQQLADATGGQYYYAPSNADLLTIYQSIADVLSNQYVVEYTTGATDGQNHTVEIEVSSGSDIGSGSHAFTTCGQFNVVLNQVDTSVCGTSTGIVSVTDGTGAPVNGLIAANFTVMEEGVVKPITSLSVAGGGVSGVSVALALDYSGSMNVSAIAALESASVDFINQLDAGDSGEVIKFAATVEVVEPYTSDRTALAASVVDMWAGDKSATAFYDATYRGITDTLTRSGRRAVVAMTDGSDNASAKSLQVLIDYANQNGVPIFTVGLGSANTSVLQKIATETGGQYYFAPTPSDLAAIYQKIANVLSGQYLFEYSTSILSGTHTVDVTVAAGGVSGSDSRQVNGCTPEGVLAGTVINSQTTLPIVGAAVTIDGPVSQTVYTDDAGNYWVTLPIGTYTVGSSASGYIVPLDQTGDVTSGATSSINFVLTQEDAGQDYRIVLTWGSSPTDLDAHLWLTGPSSCGHVYYADKGSALGYPYAQLDVDDTSSYGPETITIAQLQTGTYQYWVHNWSGTPDIVASGAQISLYDGNALLGVYNIPTSPVGNGAWHVLDIEGTTGAISVVNTLEPTTPYETCLDGGVVAHPLEVSLNGSGAGSVAVDSGSLMWSGNIGSESYAAGSVVTLTAVPDYGSTFTGWSGACSGTGNCVVTVNNATNVTATFDQASYYLYATKAGNGYGSVVSTFGISCGADCSEKLSHGMPVPVDAFPAPGSVFTGWSGDCTGTGTCMVTMDSPKVVTANFIKETHQLEVAKIGSGSGRVNSTSMGGIVCGADCTETYTSGLFVTLQAYPDPGQTFTGWSGACSGEGLCTLEMNSPKYVEAKFDLICANPGSIYSPSLDNDGKYKVSWANSITPGVIYKLYENNVEIYNGVDNYYDIDAKPTGTYSYKVIATKIGYIDSAQAGPVTTTVNLTCSAPAGMYVPANSFTGNYQVGWQVSSTQGVTYKLFENDIEIYSGTDNFVNFAGKATGTYSYKVIATKTGYTDSPEIGPFSATVSIACAAPAGLSILPGVVTGDYRVIWQISSTPGVTYKLFENDIEIYSGTDNFVDFAGKATGTYNYKVIATKTGYADSPETGPFSTSVSSACAAPGGIYAPTSNTSGKYQVNWKVSATPGVTYKLFENDIEIYSGSYNYVNFNGKSNGTYRYKVIATKTGYADSLERGPLNTVVNLTCATPLGVYVPTSNTSGKYQVSWKTSATPGVTYKLFENDIEIYSGLYNYVNFNGKANGAYSYKVLATKSGYVDSAEKQGGTVVVNQP